MHTSRADTHIMLHLLLNGENRQWYNIYCEQVQQNNDKQHVKDIQSIVIYDYKQTLRAE